MGYNKDKVDEMALTLLYLTSFQEKGYGLGGHEPSEPTSSSSVDQMLPLFQGRLSSLWN